VSRRVGAPSLVVRRSDLLQALHAALGDVPVHTGRRATGYDAGTDGVTQHFDDGGSAHGPALIAADGAHSVLRRQLAGDVGESYGPPIWRGISEADGGLEEGLALLVWGPRGGGAGGGHVAPGKIAWTVAATSRMCREPLEDAPKALLAEFVATLSPRLATAVRHTPEAEMTSARIVVRRPGGRWGLGRVTLLGDAAHAMPTALGQGGSQALEDAYTIGQAFAEADDVEAALRRYEEERRPRVDRLRTRVDRLARFSLVENPVLCGLRNLGARLAPAGSADSWEQLVTLPRR
jgi:2-polyprenyl-6-methoxyphenol hydroxylase-like FAD-dependent oxidoreductase